MMSGTVVSILLEAVQAGAAFSLRPDGVAVSKPLPAPLVAKLRANKPAVLSYLATRPRCSECGCPIVEDVRDWWNGEPVHHACGLQAWEREWKVYAPHREPAAA